MILKIAENKLNVQAEQFLLRNGYSYIYDKNRKVESYARHLTRNSYPRLHMYIQKKNDFIFFNLHLDQKKASYQGAHMHNAEYDGEIITNELLLLKKLLNGGDLIMENSKKIASSEKIKPSSGVINIGKSAEDKLGKGKLDEVLILSEKKKWWKFW